MQPFAWKITDENGHFEFDLPKMNMRFMLKLRDIHRQIFRS